MKIDNSNSNDALIKDLGPFKLKNANLAFQGNKIWEYKTLTTPEEVGTKINYGKNFNVGSVISTSIQDL
jgi:hypothetical protein